MKLQQFGGFYLDISFLFFAGLVALFVAIPLVVVLHAGDKELATQELNGHSPCIQKELLKISENQNRPLKRMDLDWADKRCTLKAKVHAQVEAITEEQSR